MRNKRKLPQGRNGFPEKRIFLPPVFPERCQSVTVGLRLEEREIFSWWSLGLGQLYFIVVVVVVVFGGRGVCTQDLTLARQVLYHLSHIPVLLL
jgi:hypothetical protein